MEIFDWQNQDVGGQYIIIVHDLHIKSSSHLQIY